jgi:ribosomal-protein-alanine N-acetyltransferase
MDDFAMVGPTLRLRVPREADAPALFALACDAEVTRWFSWGPYEREDEALAYLRRLPDERARGEQLDLAVERGGEVLGIIGLNELSHRDRRASVGTWLGRAHWGTGVNREAKALVCALAFGPLRIERVGSYANVDNARSQTALERIGFRREGVLHGWQRHGDRVLDVVVYGMLHADWAAAPLSATPVLVEGVPPEEFVVA